MPEHEHEHLHLHPPQEPENIAWKWVLGVGIVTIFLSIALSYCARCAVIDADERLAGDRATREEIPTIPAGQIEYELFEEDGRGEGERDRDARLQRLRSWGWIDREQGVVHMPIEQAMELVAQGESP